jgi:hypothetical protein
MMLTGVVKHLNNLQHLLDCMFIIGTCEVESWNDIQLILLNNSAHQLLWNKLINFWWRNASTKLQNKFKSFEMIQVQEFFEAG